MSDWPGNPIGTMVVGPPFYNAGWQNTLDGWRNGVTVTPLAITWNDAVAPSQGVADPNIDFAVAVKCQNNHGDFSITIERLSDSGWVQVALVTKSLSPPTSFPPCYVGTATDTLTASVTMTQPTEFYRISLSCNCPGLQQVPLPIPTGLVMSPYYSKGGYGVVRTFQVFTLNVGADFTLDYIPIGIVYCPPGKDMTNSVTQSLQLGTRFTVGTSGGAQAQQGFQFSEALLGILSIAFDFSQSQTFKNSQSSGVQISHYRTTVVTADNERAVDSTHWGPLGDLFIILVNPAFQISKDQATFFYALKSAEQVLIIPAWKLLKPGDDPVAAKIPQDTRKHILALDPFLQNLDTFFSANAADISTVANPYVDPSANNRAELIGRWFLDNGSVLNYSTGDTHQLSGTEANEVSYSTTAKLSASAKGMYDDISVALGLSETNTIEVGYQSSKETTAGFTTSVACNLIRHIDDVDLDGIEVYFDKIFSSLMFRRIRVPHELKTACGAVAGRIVGATGSLLQGLPITLTDVKGAVFHTTSGAGGRYSFANLEPGRYTLRAGDRAAIVKVDENHNVLMPKVVDVRGVHRVIDPENGHYWELSSTLGLSSNQLPAAVTALRKARSVAQLANGLGVDVRTRRLWESLIALRPSQKHTPSFPKKPRTTLSRHRR